MTNYPAGHIIIETNLSLHVLGAILSDRLFAGIPFREYTGGRFEGVPTLELTDQILGCEVLLQKAIDEGDKMHFSLKISPPRMLTGQMTEKKQINIDGYLRMWAREQLKENMDLIVTDLR